MSVGWRQRVMSAVPLSLSARQRAHDWRRYAFIVLGIALFLALWFGNLEFRDLVDPDEGRYAEIPREMVATGDWVTPRLNDLKYFEKPPLQYWITAISYQIFSVDEWVARLWPALAGLAGALLVFAAGSRLYDRRTGLLAAMMLLGMMLYVLCAHFLTLDMTVTLFLSATVLGIAVAQRDGAGVAERRRWMLLAWIAAGAAVLTKGLIGIVLPAGTVLAYVLMQRDYRVLRRFHALPGIALFLLVCVPWFALVSARNPEFARFFFWQEHVERYLFPGHGRSGPWWYFLPILAIGVMPFLGLLAWSAPRWWRATTAGEFRHTRFLALWVAIVLVFFSASSSKLPDYILPIFPALALLLAYEFDRVPSRTLAALLAIWSPVLVIVVWLVPLTYDRAHVIGSAAYFRDYLPWLEVGLGMLVLGLLAGAVMALRGKRVAAIATASAVSLTATTLALTGHQYMSALYSTEQSYHRIIADLADAPRDVPFYSVLMFDHSTAFELERPVILVQYRGELDLGLQAEPHKGIDTLAEFRRRWEDADDAFAIMRPETYVALEKQGLPMFLLAEDPRHALVRRRPPVAVAPR